jgi:uncharacterized protein (TIRG00374 family)
MHGIDYPLYDCIRVWTIGMFAGIVTPGRAGDVLRSFYLKQKCDKFGQCFSTVAIDRIIDLVVILFFAALGIFMFNFWFGSSLSFAILILFIIFCFGSIYLMTRKHYAKKFLKPIFNFFIPKRFKTRAMIGFHDFYDSMGGLGEKKLQLLMISLLTALMWFLSIFQVQIIGLTIGLSINYFHLLAVMSIVVIIELIPVSISGIGTRDAFMIFSLGLLSIGKESVIAFSLIYLILAYWVVALVGLLFWLRDPIKLNF